MKSRVGATFLTATVLLGSVYLYALRGLSNKPESSLYNIIHFAVFFGSLIILILLFWDENKNNL